MKTLIILFALVLIALSCKEEELRIKDENYNPVIDPVNFVESVTNNYFPLTPGNVWRYEAQTDEGKETIEITVLTETKTILGVKCTIVHDVVKLEGVVIEDTFDWYAQDKDGNVWYMGEDVSNYENGKLVDKDGSFEAGVNEAKPGIVMHANPVLEMPYRQEYSFNNAEDWGKLVKKGVTVTVPFGTYNNCLKTMDWNALEPENPREFKYYAPGVGVVKEEIEGSTEEVVLVYFGN